MAQHSCLPVPYEVPVLVMLLLPCIVTGVELAINNETSDFKLTTRLGPALSLSCAIQNNSQEEQLIWYRGDGAVDLKDGNQMNASHLCLSPVTETDNGVAFTCKLKRDQSIQVSVILDVQFRPILSGKDSLRAEEESDVTLICNVKSNPQAQVAWYKDNIVLTLEAKRHQIHQTSEVSKLSITKAQKSDMGVYTCVANSSLGEDRKDFHLVIEDKKPVFPIEAIAAAAVVVLLTIVFGVVAQREKILKCFVKKNETPSETAL
ncbi:PREDICTED: transmembrane and immunoglobulin domain-containing protein 1 isoform X2 [Gavialis gangeticus]|uniref:transmembrane and immunoglobulin domain-containing protein 1 isoform X1 n=1 Tax=Gavialis gangeticus TaxID=94835 RepID=UPI00092EDBEF|nr:PREDICTED: transmembrane and immunoglobulin domain-containing protein 1 isoform X1 [Gavialis gangeticus]XP_019366776.1 PREDICTED: transmembrane and immunoglobulin domain-containing protein 1 isoform X2 [Gavialis gangeticus]